MFSNLFSNFSIETQILLSLFIILSVSFLMTRITKLLKLPNVTAYIIAGVLIGPAVLGIIPQIIVDNMGFISDIALAFIAFGVGKFFKKDVLKKTGIKVIIITILEAVMAFIVVTIFVCFVFRKDLNFALLLGAIATATAPASTMMTIKQYNAKGHFVETLLQVVALDDVVCLFIFSIASVFASNSSGNIKPLEIILPIIYNILLIALGFVLGFVLNKLLGPSRSKDNRLIIIVAMLLGLSGLCGILEISPLLSCMIFGATYINVSYDKYLYHQLDNFTPPIMTIFFVLSGMKLDLHSLFATSLGLIGVTYFIIRIVGKYFGAWLGGTISKDTKEVKRYLGLALIPQAGVSIGLAFLAERILPPDLGLELVTIILSSSVLYELIGPACAKFAIYKSCDINPNAGLLNPTPTPSEVTSDNLSEGNATKVDDSLLDANQEDDTKNNVA